MIMIMKELQPIDWLKMIKFFILVNPKGGKFWLKKFRGRKALMKIDMGRRKEAGTLLKLGGEEWRRERKIILEFTVGSNIHIRFTRDI